MDLALDIESYFENWILVLVSDLKSDIRDRASRSNVESTVGRLKSLGGIGP